MLALVGLGFADRVRRALVRLDNVLINEGLLRTCGDAWWDSGRFDSDRIILCRILVDLGASLDCENEFRWKPVQIAECWNRRELVHFLTNPVREEVTPVLLPVSQSQQRKMEQILRQKQQREQHLEKQREMVRQQPVHPLSLFPKFNRRKSYETLPVDERQIDVEIKGLSATNKEKPLVCKGQPLKLRVPKSSFTGTVSAPVSPASSTSSIASGCHGMNRDVISQFTGGFTSTPRIV